MVPCRILITSDIHCTDQEDWHGVSDEDRMEHQLIPLGADYANKVIAQTGNFSYTMSGADSSGFWGFRDLVIGEDKAVSSYIMVDSDVIQDGKPVHFDRRISQVQEYMLK